MTSTRNKQLTLEQYQPRRTTLAQKLAWEHELLGVYLSGSPLDGRMRPKDAIPISSLDTDDPDELIELNGKAVMVCGVVTTVRELTTRTGKPMAVVNIEDKTGRVEAVVFPSAYTPTRHVWREGDIVAADGTFELETDPPRRQLVVNGAKTLYRETPLEPPITDSTDLLASDRRQKRLL